MAGKFGYNDIEDIKKSFHESVSLQMSTQMEEFSKKMLHAMDEKITDSFGRGGNGSRGRGNHQRYSNRGGGGHRGGGKNQRNYNRNGNKNQGTVTGNGGAESNNNHDSAFIVENVKSKPKRVNPYFGKNSQAGFATKMERKNVKEFVNFNKTEGTSRNLQCECEIVVNCIRYFNGTYEENTLYDKKEALRALKKFDTNVSSKEIRNVRRHPGQQTGDYIKVTVLFGNSETPSRLAQKAEDDNDFSVLQRSLPKDIRERNKATLSKVSDLNEARSKEDAFLWTTTMVKGLVILIQEPDPHFVMPQEKSQVEDEQFQDSEEPDAETPTHSQNLEELNRKLKENGSPPVNNIPEMAIEDYIEELTPKYGGINKAMITAILKTHGMKSRTKTLNIKPSKESKISKGGSSR